jgi:hypothetical protein
VNGVSVDGFCFFSSAWTATSRGLGCEHAQEKGRGAQEHEEVGKGGQGKVRPVSFSLTFSLVTLRSRCWLICLVSATYARSEKIEVSLYVSVLPSLTAGFGC